MAVFCLSNSAKRCRFLCSVLKDPFSSCRTCHRGYLSCSGVEEEEEEETPITDFNDVQDVLVSMIRNRAMEAKLRKVSMVNHNYSFVVHPTSGVLFVSKAKQQAYDDNSTQKQDNSKGSEEVDDFASVKTHFSTYIATADDSEAYFSCCSDPDLDESRWWVFETLDSSEVKRRSIIQEVCHCEGWPFGLCRKTLLLPPLPKSPSESWSWCKTFPKTVKAI
ncbi:uncharacterized protein [Spinacia oleracea]|uniref:Uncharacterized protein n=1 Tax=Spinacia oleracea TaxID=3562 RepID=A0A9R0J4H2_SPIOL|nr:uncharacterized protein LOC110800085 [Spinacia oleracea]